MSNVDISKLREDFRSQGNMFEKNIRALGITGVIPVEVADDLRDRYLGVLMCVADLVVASVDSWKEGQGELRLQIIALAHDLESTRRERDAFTQQLEDLK